MELKCMRVIELWSTTSFNRTFMELKLEWEAEQEVKAESFNRTFMELKSFRAHYHGCLWTF